MKHFADLSVNPYKAGTAPKGAPVIGGMYVATLCGQTVHRSEITRGRFTDCPLCRGHALCRGQAPYMDEQRARLRNLVVDAAEDDPGEQNEPRCYVVKCDVCKRTIRHTYSAHESACGGICDHCRAEA